MIFPCSLSLGAVQPSLGGKAEYAPSMKQKAFQCFFDHMGLGDHTVVTNIIMVKVGNPRVQRAHALLEPVTYRPNTR